MILEITCLGGGIRGQGTGEKKAGEVGEAGEAGGEKYNAYLLITHYY
ncbi:hypothetical protein H6G36_25875 [Anabaena minutissima FACHB-250]|nr:hypothetical protein [Anabaena minutissima FACHB-250]